MEVHHHPHVEKKNFKEYFLEFLMIFLAVTMGFFAESLREHVNDNSKENEYINSLRKDLIADTINTKTWMLGFNTRIQQYDSVVNMMRQPEKITNGSRLYYLARLSTRGTVFEDNNNTMIQLNISGNFRLIRNKAIAETIVAYQNDIDNYKRVSEYDSYEARAFYGPQMKIFNAFIFNDMSKPITDSSPQEAIHCLVVSKTCLQNHKVIPNCFQLTKRRSMIIYIFCIKDDPPLQQKF
jgi:hypothetical protein